MSDEFNSSRINILGNFFMEGFNKYPPGFMCVGSKSRTFGYKRDTTCCGLTSILCRFQILEGKYRSRPLGQKEYNELGKTVC